MVNRSSKTCGICATVRLTQIQGGGRIYKVKPHFQAFFGGPLGRLSYNLSLSGPVAQLVEQRIENPRVGSSILPQATMFIA